MLGEHRVRVQDDQLLLDLELRLFNDLAVHRDPATFDIELGFAARAAYLFGQAFGEANRISHAGGRKLGGAAL